MFGNGGYVFYEPAGLKRTPWNYFATEIALVGTLQRRYVGEEVAAVEYWDAGTWRTLPELLARGVEPTVPSWNPQPTALRCVKVVYQNGLRVLVNRLDEAFDAATLAPELANVDFGGRSPVDFSAEIAGIAETAQIAKETRIAGTSEEKWIDAAGTNGEVGEVGEVGGDASIGEKTRTRLILPKSGWVAWTADGEALAFSGVVAAVGGAESATAAAEKNGRIDFIDDKAAGVRYVDPRGGVFEGRSTPTLWLDGEIVPGWDAADWEYKAD